MSGTLFVTHQYVVQSVGIIIKCVVDGHYGSAGITEQRVHTLIEQ